MTGVAGAVPPLLDPHRLELRPARLADMAQVGPLINGFAMRGIMLPKSLEQLHRNFREFVVAREVGGRVLGCVALRVFSPDLAELSALAVATEATGRGIGRRLVDAVVEEAEALGIGTLFALTLEPGFFHRLGFETVPRALFPQKIAADCDGCDRRGGCREITVARSLGPDAIVPTR